MSHKSSDVYRTAFLTIDGTLDSNNSQLYFRPLQYPLQPVSGHFYSLSPAQSTDPTIRINQWSQNGTLVNYGFLYDTEFNPLPPGALLLVAGGTGPSIMIYSTDGVTWIASSNGATIFNGGVCKAVGWNGFTWVAGASATAASTLAYSSNGIVWNASPSASLCPSGCNAIVTDGSLWTAGVTGPLNTVIYSYDGIHWYRSITGNSYLTTACFAGAWNGLVWLLGGSGTYNLIYSNDGLSWFPSNNGNTIFTKCQALAWNGSLWLAGGTPGTGRTNTIAYSYDGINWTGISADLRTSCNAIAWSGSIWTAGGTDPSNNTLIYSTDGFTWRQATNNSTLFTSCNTITWTGTVFIAGGAGTQSFLNSYDGINWTPITSADTLLSVCNASAVNKVLPNAPISQHIATVVPSTPITLLGGTNAIISSSYDGITWSPNNSANFVFANGTCLALSWDGNQWVAGTQGSVFTVGNSNDGIVWNGNASASSLLGNSCNALANNGGTLWLAGGKGTSRIIYSNNGLLWADASANSIFDTSACHCIGWNGSVWVAGADSSSNRLAYSYDGSANWSASSSGNALFPSICSSVAWNGQLWVAVGDSGTIAHSTDGITWIRATSIPATTYWSSVAWNGILWTVAGSGSTVLAYSYDGDTWSSSANGNSIFTTNSLSVAWNGTIWIAAGNGRNTAAYSYNGITWIPSYNSVSVIGTGVCVGTNRALATAGASIPPSTLYQTSSSNIGKAVYTTGYNDLYTSTTLSINDVSAAIGINKLPTSYTDVTSNIIRPNLDISGQGIWNATDDAVLYPTLTLANINSAGTVAGYAGRVLFQNNSSNWGWSIDSLWGERGGIPLDKSLQIVQWNNNTSNLAMDFNEYGQVGIKCLPNAVPSVLGINFQLDVSGGARIQGPFNATGHIDLFGDLSANAMQGSRLSILSHIDTSDLSANILATNTLFTSNIRCLDISASRIQTTGPITSSLSLTSRGSVDISVNLIESPNTLSQWRYRYPISGPAASYSVFLVTVNASFDASNVNIASNILDISVNGVTRYFSAGFADTSGGRIINMIVPLSFTFIVNPIANEINISGYASSGIFLNTNSAGNYLTSIGIVGLT